MNTLFHLFYYIHNTIQYNASLCIEYMYRVFFLFHILLKIYTVYFVGNKIKGQGQSLKWVLWDANQIIPCRTQNKNIYVHIVARYYVQSVYLFGEKNHMKELSQVPMKGVESVNVIHKAKVTKRKSFMKKSCILLQCWAQSSTVLTFMWVPRAVQIVHTEILIL